MARTLNGTKKRYFNRKVLNATPLEYKGIYFRSKLEIYIYQALEELNLEFTYEEVKAKIWDAQKFRVPYYDKYGRQGFTRIERKPLPVHYTPDFVVKYKNWVIYLEAKGKANDVFPYKVRLFRQWLEAQQDNLDKQNLKACYAVVYSRKNLLTLLSDLDEND